MILIDVNKLKENLTTEIYSYSKGDIRKRLFARGLSLAYDIVNRQPTVEPKHGHWVNDERGASGALGLFVICSECHRYSMGYFPYCPYCGAKMDETANIPRHNGKSMMELERLIGEVEDGV